LTASRVSGNLIRLGERDALSYFEELFLRFETLMISCREREQVRKETLERLTATDWSSQVEVILDDESGATPLDRILRTWSRAIRRAAESSANFVLLLEDDLLFGRWLESNLLAWTPVLRTLPGQAFYASLYNPGLHHFHKSVRERFVVISPQAAWGSQAILMTPMTLRYVLSRWNEDSGNADERMARLASRVTPLYYHVPSLVEHAPVATTWGGISHRARDFDPSFRSNPGPPPDSSVDERG
jgi:hypothetical protein